jgi:hypothetical protein
MSISAFDEAACGQYLTLSVADTIVQTSKNVDAHRMVRSKYPAQKASTVEFYFYSPNGHTPSLAPVSGVPPLVLGFCTKDAALNKFLGEDLYGYSWCPGDGNLRNNNEVIATFAVAPLNTYVSMTVDLVNATATFAIGKTVIGSVALPAGQIYYAGTVSGDIGELALQANAGQDPQRNPTTAGYWTHLDTGITPIFLATEDFLSSPIDPIPNQQFAGDVDRSHSPMVISRGFVPWVLGSSKPSAMGESTQLQISLKDPNNIYAPLVAGCRNQLARIQRGYLDSAMSTFENVFTAVLDKCEKTGDQTKMLYATGKLALLESQPIRAQFAPNDDPAVRGKSRPMQLGVRRNHTPPFFNAKLRNVAIADMPIASFGKIRIGGVEKALGIDLVVLANSEDANLTSDPQGTVLVETSTYGGTYTTDSTDALAGDGEFGAGGNAGGPQTATSTSSITVGTGNKAFVVGTGKSFANGSIARATSTVTNAWMQGTVTYSGSTLTINVTSTSGVGTDTHWSITGGVNQPTNWEGGGGYPNDPLATVFQVSGSGSAHYIHQEQKADAIYWLKHKTMLVQPGESIAYEVDVRGAPYTGTSRDASGNTLTIDPAYLTFAGMTGAAVSYYAWTKFAVPAAGVYRGFFTNTQTTALPLIMGNLCNNLIDGSGGVFSALDLNHIRVARLPDILQNVDFKTVPLDWVLRQLMIAHGPLKDADYNPAGAVAIDAATGYSYGVGGGADDSTLIKDYVQRVCASSCSGVYETRDGQIGVAQFVDPDLVADANLAFDLVTSQFETPVITSANMAEGLSTRISGGENINPQSVSDFASATLTAVPQQVRDLLQQKFQWTKAAGVSLAECYASAERADPLPSALDREVDGQTEATRVNSIFVKERFFHESTVKTPIAAQLDIGQVGRITYDPTYVDQLGNVVHLNASEPIASGIKVQILWMVEQPSEGSTLVIFHG